MNGSPQPGKSYGELLEWAYCGEVFGVLFLDSLLADDAHSDNRDTLTLLRELEAVTMRRLASHMGDDLDPSDEAVIAAADFARDVASMTWQQFMEATAAIAHQALPSFERLAEQAPPAATRDMTAVLDHERSLLAFAEQDEPRDHSVLTAHLHQYPTQPSPRTRDDR